MAPPSRLELPANNARPYPPDACRRAVLGGGTLHHVIPYSLLRKVWKAVLDGCLDSHDEKAWMAMRQYLLLCDPELRDADALIQRLRVERPFWQRRTTSTEVPLGEFELEKLHKAVAWQSWNLVAGPSSRLDEPADGKPDLFRIGLEPDEKMRMRAVEALHEVYEDLVRLGPGVSAGALGVFASAIRGHRQALQGMGPVPYRKEMWVQEGMKWRKARRGENEGG
jgi:hypothetical protein